MSNWKAEDFGQFVEVVPLNDRRPHLAGDECWCNPEVERAEGNRPLITHNESGEVKTVSYDTAIHKKVNEWMLFNGFEWVDEPKDTWHKFNEEQGHIYVHQSAAAYFFRKEVGTKRTSPPNNDKGEI